MNSFKPVCAFIYLYIYGSTPGGFILSIKFSLKLITGRMSVFLLVYEFKCTKLSFILLYLKKCFTLISVYPRS